MANKNETMSASPRRAWGWRLLWLCLALALTALDQWTKRLAAAHLKSAPRVLIDGVLELTYAENTGAAWSMLSGKQILLIALTAVMLGAVLVLLLCGKWRNGWLLAGETLLLAGGVGNLIDRVWNGCVVDFIYVKAIHFPIFNVADCCVCLGAIGILIDLIWLEKGDLRGNDAPAAANGGGTAGQDGSASPFGDESHGTKMD